MFTKLMKIKNELVENKFLTLKIINHFNVSCISESCIEIKNLVKFLFSHFFVVLQKVLSVKIKI